MYKYGQLANREKEWNSSQMDYGLPKDATTYKELKLGK